MEGELGQLVVNGGVSVVLAFVVMRWMRSDLVRRAEECKECAARALGLAESERGDKLAMMEALQRNTEAITRLVDAVRALGGNGRLEGKYAGMPVGYERGYANRIDRMDTDRQDRTE